MHHIQAFHSEFGAPNDAADITQFFTLTNTDETKNTPNQIFEYSHTSIRHSTYNNHILFLSEYFASECLTSTKYAFHKENIIKELHFDFDDWKCLQQA